MNSLKNILRVIAMSFLLLLPAGIFAQNKSLDWINKNADELNSGSTSTNQDLRFLSKVLKGKRVVGLGEASHGTQEFFFQKRRIIEYLVSNHNYRLIALEFQESYIESINNYIQTGNGDLKDMFSSMALYNSDEIYRLCQWLKLFNEFRLQNDKVRIIGFDDKEYWSNPFTRDEKMAENFIEFQKQGNPKSILWSHNVHLAKDTTMSQYKAMGFHIKKQYGDDYYVIGFDTYCGSVNMIKNDGRFESHNFTGAESTFSALFNKADFETFFIDFHKPGNPLLNTKNFITNLYSEWQEPKPLPIVPGTDFDGLIFVRKTTASVGAK